MIRMTLSSPVSLPDQYRETVLAFLRQYFDDLVWELRNHLGIELDIEQLPASDDDYLRLMVADAFSEIARAAAGDTENLDQATVYEGIQGLVEKLFAIPGETAYTIPHEFWLTPFGAMTLQAFVWSQGDELLTVSQAAEISGRSIQDLSNRIKRGKLTAYADPSEPNPVRRTRVLRREIESLPLVRGRLV